MATAILVCQLNTYCVGDHFLISELLDGNRRGCYNGGQKCWDLSSDMWPFTRKRAITAFRFRTEFRLEPVWKPFERNLHSFERPGSSVQKNLHPFERLDHPFDRNVQPFEWLAHPFGKSIHPFERLAHPFDKNVQPFERLTHPFVKNIQPFERLAHPFAGTSIRSNDLSMRQSYERLSFPVRVLA